MYLLENPFYILGATLQDNRRRIMELAEERSLSLDPNKCTEARNELTNPRKRLTAEIAWLLGVEPENTAKLLQILESCPERLLDVDIYDVVSPIAYVNLLASGIIRLQEINVDNIVGWVLDMASEFEDIDTEELMDIINEEREVSNFPQISDSSLIGEEIDERCRFFCKTINECLGKLTKEERLRAITNIVESATNTGEKQAPVLISKFIDLYYESEAQKELDKGAENINNIIKEIRETAESKRTYSIATLIDKLIKATKDWDIIAQPIQVIAKSSGHEDETSLEMSRVIRNFAIYLSNEHSMYDYSLQITQMLREVFAENDEVVERVAEDADTLKNLTVFGQIDNLLDDVYKTIKGFPTLGVKEGGRILLIAPEIITKMEIAKVEFKTIQKYKDQIAMALMACIVTYLNNIGVQFVDWSSCITILKVALDEYATSPDVTSRIQENLLIVSENYRRKFSEVGSKRDEHTIGYYLIQAAPILLPIIILIIIGWCNNTSSTNKTAHNGVGISSNEKTQNISSNFYEQPSVGVNNILSVSEIRWCNREDIRIAALRGSIINAHAVIEKYNNMVSNYNSRCANYRYKESVRQRAVRDVNALQRQIEEEAINEFKRFEDSLRRTIRYDVNMKSKKIDGKAFDGKVVYYAKVDYPIITSSSPNPVVDTLNKEFEKEANQYYKKLSSEKTSILDNYYSGGGYSYPYFDTLSCTVQYNQGGVISFLWKSYSYKGGARGRYHQSGETYDILTGKILKTSDN